jgi:dolichyl-phosphate-mannose-protein mannosyltransferase
MSLTASESASSRDWLVPVLAMLGACGLALPAVWWEPLHVDEAITLQFAGGDLSKLVGDVFVERGESIAHFVLEYVSLEAVGGIEGLRLPNVVFFALAIGAASALARTLLGSLEANLLAVALAVAPLAVGLSTFARMYALFLLGVLLATLVAVEASKTRSVRWWTAAGLLAGALVHVHPIAPLYLIVPILAPWAASGRPARAIAREASRGIWAGLLVAAPFAYALAVLTARYGVGPHASRVATTAGRTVPEETLRAFAPGGSLGAAALAAAALLGAAVLARSRRRLAVLLVAWVVVPLAFFTIIPAETRFYPRYLLAALPAYLLLGVVGCCAVGALLHRRTLIAAALVALFAATALTEDLRRLDRLRALSLPELAASAARGRTILFSSTGSSVAGRPAELIDLYVIVEHGVEHVDELPAIDPAYATHLEARGRARTRQFLATTCAAHQGAWIFSGRERRIVLALRRLRHDHRFTVLRPSPTMLLVKTRVAAGAAKLLALGIVVRRAWSIRSPSDRWNDLLITIDGRALAAGPAPCG